MSSYVLRRLLLMVPTLFGIMLLNFVIVQAAPGGPVERMLAQMQGMDSDLQSRMGGQVDTTSTSGESKTRGAQGLDPELIARIENSTVSTSLLTNVFLP